MGVIFDFAKHVRDKKTAPTATTFRISRGADEGAHRALSAMLQGISAYVPRRVSERLQPAAVATQRVSSVRQMDAMFIGDDVVRSEMIEICGVADLLFSYFGTGRVDRPRIVYAPIMDAKVVVDPQQPLSCEEVNSGVTDSSAAKTIVLLFRRQEAVKVLVHELVHALGKDVLRNRDGEAGARLAAEVGLASSVPVLLNEAYTETLASFLYATLISRGEPSATRVALDAMKRHFLAQAEKVLCVYYSPTRGMAQRTHVFEYYVVKAALFAKRTPRQVAMLIDRGDVGELMAVMAADAADYVRSRACDLTLFGGATPKSPVCGRRAPRPPHSDQL